MLRWQSLPAAHRYCRSVAAERRPAPGRTIGEPFGSQGCRSGFAAMLERIEGNGAHTIIAGAAAHLAANRAGGFDALKYATHSIGLTKATLNYRRTGNLRAVQLLLRHRKIGSTVRYLGVEVDAEKIDAWTTRHDGE